MLDVGQSGLDNKKPSHPSPETILENNAPSTAGHLHSHKKEDMEMHEEEEIEHDIESLEDIDVFCNNCASKPCLCDLLKLELRISSLKSLKTPSIRNTKYLKINKNLKLENNKNELSTPNIDNLIEQNDRHWRGMNSRKPSHKEKSPLNHQGMPKYKFEEMEG